MWSLPQGIYLLGSRSGDHRNLMTTSWVTQLAHDPKLFGVAVEREAVTHELIMTGHCFSLSLIARKDRGVVRHFVRPAAHDHVAATLEGVHYRDSVVSGAPIPDVAAAWLDCALERAVELGSHTLFVGQVVDAGFAADTDSSIEYLRMEDTRMNYGG
jgi:flavin reductase (DIM6/NTAB) family NADH-FMN oxidoreductase RutF